MNVYGITIKGNHPDFFNKRFYGIAENISDSMHLCLVNAGEVGWDSSEIEDVTLLGKLDFFPKEFYRQ